jgi:PAS domain S-box-containing protein/putative nucleotidyltransferase with HDIG domain
MRDIQYSRVAMLKRNTRFLMLAWSAVVATSLGWTLYYHQHSFDTSMRAEAKSIHAMDMEYRNWIIHSGGVYVPVGGKVVPSPWLSHVPERDVTTPSGKKLTLLNSSYVVRLVHEGMGSSGSELRGHIASLKPINPDNAADAWERRALEAFSRGDQESFSLDSMPDGLTYFRYMKPMVTEESCLKCHAQYGDKLGDIRGGVSIAIPVDALLAAEAGERTVLTGGHTLIWLLGIFGLGLSARRQERAISEIEKREEQVTLLTNSIAHAIYGQDLDGHCTFANDACVKALGYEDASELLGRDMHALVHHTHADGSPYPYEKCPTYASISEGKSFHVDDEILWRKDGSSFPAAYWSYPVIKESRTHGAVVTFLDISEQLRMRDELKRSQALLNTIVEHIPAMVFLKRAEDLRFELFNRAGEELLGYARADLLGKNDYDFFPQDQAESFTRKDREVLESHRLWEIAEEPIKTADGGEKWLHTSKVGLYDEAGQPAYLLGISVDITGRKLMEDQLREQHQILEQALEGTIHTISMAVELRDPYTAGHQRGVAELAGAIARAMGLDEERIRGIRLGATIHDIGKIGVPAEVLSKPSRLSDIEMRIVREHARMGYEILKDGHFPWPVAEIAHQHHERIDGSGYPLGLKGEAIILEARIIAVADVVESMASHRPYRPALGLPAALDEIVAHRGSLYDAQVVDACRQVLEGGFKFT